MSEQNQGTQLLTHYEVGERIYGEAVGEYTLPDYQPEIRKILHIRAAVLPTGTYIGGQKAEFAGRVAHTVLYADAEGKAASVTLDTDYTFSAPTGESGTYTAVADAVAESTVCRLGGPRKLSLRTRVRGTVCVGHEENVAPDIRGMGSEADMASLEMWEETRDCMRLENASSGEFPLSTTRHMDGTGENTRVVWAGGTLLVNECRVTAGGVNCRGDAWVRCILQEEGLPPCTVREKIPFEQFVPVDGMGEGADCVACGRVVMTDVTLVAGEGEMNGTLGFDLSCEVDVLTVTPYTCSLTKDLYSTAYDMTCHHRHVDTVCSLGMAQGHYTVGGNRPRRECEAENATAVVDTDGRVEVERVGVEHGRVTVFGRVLATVIFAATDEGQDSLPLLSSCEVTCPFRVETDLRPTEESTPQFAVHVDLISARGRIEPNAIAVDGEIAVCLCAYACGESEILQSAEPDRSVAVERSGSRMYTVYPKEGDTLFSLCARYHKKRASVAAGNALAEDAVAISHLTHSLDGVHHLLLSDDM